jgi:hypothetical protein
MITERDESNAKRYIERIAKFVGENKQKAVDSDVVAAVVRRG